MKYSSYNRNYYEPEIKHRHKIVINIGLNILSKTKIISRYYFDLINLIRSLPVNARILDVGSANGGFITFIRNIRNDLSIVCIDLKMTDNIKNLDVEHFELDFINSNLEALGKFDLVHSRHLIEHLKIKDVPKYFSNCFKILKKKGLLYVLTPTPQYYFYDDYTHVRPYNKTSISRLILNNDFNIIKVVETYEFNIIHGMKFVYGIAQKK